MQPEKKMPSVTNMPVKVVASLEGKEFRFALKKMNAEGQL